MATGSTADINEPNVKLIKKLNYQINMRDVTFELNPVYKPHPSIIKNISIIMVIVSTDHAQCIDPSSHNNSTNSGTKHCKRYNRAKVLKEVTLN